MCILFSFDDFFLTTRRGIGIDCDSCRWSEAESRPTDTSLHRLFVFTEPRFCQLGRVYVMQASPYSRHWPERHRPTRDYRWAAVSTSPLMMGSGGVNRRGLCSRPPFDGIVRQLTESPCPVVSVDVPPCSSCHSGMIKGHHCRFGMYGSCQQGIHQLTNWKEVIKRSPVSLVLLIFYFFEKLHVTLFCSCFWNWCWKHHPVASWRMLHNEEFDQSIAKKVARGEFLKKWKRKENRIITTCYSHFAFFSWKAINCFRNW